MKNNYVILLLLSVILAASQTGCSKVLYQVFEVKSADPRLDASMMYNGGAVNVAYDFWSKTGLVYFRIINNTQKPVYIDWDQAHFIINGLSREYYGDGTSNATMTSLHKKGYGGMFTADAFKLSTNISHQVGIQAKRLVEIPAGAFISAADFNLSGSILADCDLRVSPEKKTASKDYTEANSPIVFRNYLTYYTSLSDTTGAILDNTFYVVNITSMMKPEFEGPLQTAKESCKICPGGKKATMEAYTYPFKQRNRFYVSCTSGKVR